MSKVFVGLDYHKDLIQVCIMDSAGAVLANRVCINDSNELALLVAFFGEAVEGAIEACTGSANIADELITRHGWNLSLAHPGYVNRMKQSPDKSDYSDARMLADLRARGLPPQGVACARGRSSTSHARPTPPAISQRTPRNQASGNGALRENRVNAGKLRRWTRAWLAWSARRRGFGVGGPLGREPPSRQPESTRERDL